MSGEEGFNRAVYKSISGCFVWNSRSLDELVAAARRVLKRDNLTLKQRREIADTLSTRAVSFDVETDVGVETKGGT